MDNEATLEVQRKTVVRGYPDQQNPEASVVYTAQSVPVQATVTRIVREETVFRAQSTPLAQSTRLSAAQQREYEQQRQHQQQHQHAHYEEEQHATTHQYRGSKEDTRQVVDRHDAHYHGRAGKYPSAVHEKLHHLLGDDIMAHKLLLPLLATLLIGSLLALFIYLLSRRRTQKRGKRSVLVMGEADSGKTALWSMLAKNQLYESVASMTENVAPYYDRSRNAVVSGKKTTVVTTTTTKTTNNKKTDVAAEDVAAGTVERFSLIDVPGHHRVRPMLVNKYKTDAVAIVYVINCATLKKSGWEVSNNLYDVMIDEDLSKLPLLIVCNRAEGDDAADTVRQMLEANFNTIRKSHFNPAKKEYVGYLGNPNRDFTFQELGATDAGNKTVARAPQFVVIPEWKRETWQGDNKTVTKEVRSATQIDRVSDWLASV